ncbi:ribosomal L7Ae/L30e/S12e/Gadd45 family protein [Geosporobacter ferrireducens]|uniref:50S ribosomal protein L7 n=1 Tax=Geosporobacter ferrireducens TaxID=1424294 RepID=A0A1D8GJY3_9FIRM|nr:ribosomal L7Ae/L30e/S12e/Gadd45 family protein [Geosporobacter ferrireducens]AOT71162.1 50S ribosomal protein L7 [Geosporobacter ferrireducens]MTI57974.1 50S ribosomal protein L7ae-like protein [Geosporobacter ferrireducens]
MLDELKKQNKLIVGSKQGLKAIKEDRAQTLFIAKDAERHVTRTIEEAGKESQIQIVYVDSMKKLGKACGIEVGAAIAVILK